MARKSSIKPMAMIDGRPAELLPTSNRDRRLPLKTAQNVRAEIARVYREMRTGRMQPEMATKLTYVLAVLGRMIEAGDLEQRVEALENQKRRL